MTREEVFETLNGVFQDVFDDESITVNEATTAEDIDDWDSLEHSLVQEGYTAIDVPTPAPALDGRRVVFLMNPFLGMIELLETAAP